jgi:hypothetical protein|tara:strand:+ start:256 stop:555 length:300 start_codon:yes stop_codon:yes gene_type:complete
MTARKKRAVNNYKSPLDQEQEATQNDENTPSDDDMPIAASDSTREDPQASVADSSQSQSIPVQYREVRNPVTGPGQHIFIKVPVDPETGEPIMPTAKGA